MKTLAPVIFSLSMLAVGPAIGAEALDRDLETFQGSWRMVAKERDGEKKEVPNAVLNVVGEAFTTVIDGKLVESGKIVLGPDKQPKTYVATMTGEVEDKGKAYYGIYELDDDSLRTCANTNAGNAGPTEFAARNGTGHQLVAWKRISDAPSSEIDGEWKPTPNKSSVVVRWANGLQTITKDGQLFSRLRFRVDSSKSPKQITYWTLDSSDKPLRVASYEYHPGQSLICAEFADSEKAAQFPSKLDPLDKSLTYAAYRKIPLRLNWLESTFLGRTIDFRVHPKKGLEADAEIVERVTFLGMESRGERFFSLTVGMESLSLARERSPISSGRVATSTIVFGVNGNSGPLYGYGLSVPASAPSGESKNAQDDRQPSVQFVEIDLDGEHISISDRSVLEHELWLGNRQKPIVYEKQFAFQNSTNGGTMSLLLKGVNLRFLNSDPSYGGSIRFPVCAGTFTSPRGLPTTDVDAAAEVAGDWECISRVVAGVNEVISYKDHVLSIEPNGVFHVKPRDKPDTMIPLYKGRISIDRSSKPFLWNECGANVSEYDGRFHSWGTICAIYQLAGDTLTICASKTLRNNLSSRPKEVSSTKENQNVLTVYRRVTKRL